MCNWWFLLHKILKHYFKIGHVHPVHSPKWLRNVTGSP